MKTYDEMWDVVSDEESADDAYDTLAQVYLLCGCSTSVMQAVKATIDRCRDGW